MSHQTLYELGQRFVGHVIERPGPDQDHPFIRWCHSLTTYGEAGDHVPWCSSFLNALCWLHGLPRTRSAAARSWLTVGQVITLEEAEPAYDVVILRRGSSPTAGHVGLYSGREASRVYLLGGNQGDAVTVAPFLSSKVIGVRRLMVT